MIINRLLLQFLEVVPGVRELCFVNNDGVKELSIILAFLKHN